MEIIKLMDYDAIVDVTFSNGSVSTTFVEFDVTFDRETPVVTVSYTEINTSQSMKTQIAEMIRNEGNHHAWYADYLEEIGDRQRDSEKSE